MCCSIDLLKNVQAMPRSIHLALPNGHTVLVDKSGSFEIHPSLTLHGVLFVPSFGYNLLSVSKWISDTGGDVSFFRDHCEFHDKSSSVPLAKGKLIDGLYHLEFQNMIFPAETNSVINTVMSKSNLSALWHLRLGHVYNQVLHKIPGVCDNIVDSCNQQCPVCPLSKQTKLPFPISTSHATHKF